MPAKLSPENEGEQVKPSSIEGKHVGETWGETKKRIVLEKVKESGTAGFPVADVSSAFRKYVYDHERAVGGRPEDVDDVVDSDDVSFTLLDLEKEGLIEIKEGRIFTWWKKKSKEVKVSPESLEDQKHRELQEAMDEEDRIMGEINKVLADTPDRAEAEKIVLEKWAPLMDEAGKNLEKP